MPKPVNCCVPGCVNNFRNSSGLHYYRIPKDRDLRKEYVRLLRNKTLKLDSDNRRICSSHFEGGKKIDRKHLPSIFPWTKAKQSRRPLQGIELSVINESFTRNLKENVSLGHAMATKTTNETRVECSADMVEDANTFKFQQQELPQEFFYRSSFADAATQTDVSDFSVNGHENSIRELNETVEKLSRELKQLQCQLEQHKFDIENYKDSPKDIAFYTGFQDYETLLLCYSLVEDAAKNINYGSHTKLTDDSKLGRPRKLSCFNEFILVCMKL